MGNLSDVEPCSYIRVRLQGHEGNADGVYEAHEKAQTSLTPIRQPRHGRHPSAATSRISGSNSRRT